MMCCKNCGWLRWVTTTDTSYYCEFVGGKFLGDLSDCCQAWKPKMQTNADKIRSMTDEELAKFLIDVQTDCASYCSGETVNQYYPFPEGWNDWLKEEVKE